METNAECVCCREIFEMVAKTDEANDPSILCITRQPGFNAVCLNVWVLQAAYFQYRQEHGRTSPAPPTLHEYVNSNFSLDESSFFH